MNKGASLPSNQTTPELILSVLLYPGEEGGKRNKGGNVIPRPNTIGRFFGAKNGKKSRGINLEG